MRWLPIGLNLFFILFALVLRSLISLRVDIYHLRLTAAHYTWLVMLVCVLVGLSSVFLWRHKRQLVLNAVLSLIALRIWYSSYDYFLPY